MTFFNSFISHVNRQHLFPTGERVLLAVSGGVDSTVLAHLMHRAGFPFAIAHCNFRLRPGDCDRDEDFVRRLADGFGVPFHLARFDTADYAAAQGLGIEDAARRLRYGWFATLCRQQGYPALLTAHHADDSAETFFLNLLRGTGLAGLHGILPVTSPDAFPPDCHVVRPLLPFCRADIEAYAAAHAISHCEDYTNASLLYRRNQVRHQLLPLLESLQPAFRDSLSATIAHLQSTEALYRHLLAPLRERYLVPQPDGSSRLLLRQLLADHPSALHSQLLFEFLHPLGFNDSQRQSLLATPRSGARFHTPTHTAVIHQGDLIIAPAPAKEMPTMSSSSPCQGEAAQRDGGVCKNTTASTHSSVSQADSSPNLGEQPKIPLAPTTASDRGSHSSPKLGEVSRRDGGVCKNTTASTHSSVSQADSSPNLGEQPKIPLASTTASDRGSHSSPKLGEVSRRDGGVCKNTTASTHSSVSQADSSPNLGEQLSPHSIPAPSPAPTHAPTLNFQLSTFNSHLLPPDYKSLAPNTVFFDADTLREPLSLRHWRHGDRFQPLGMAHGTQLVSDFFTDHHFSLPAKERQLLLVDADDTILWIVGHRTSHPHRITPATRRILQVSLNV